MVDVSKHVQRCQAALYVTVPVSRASSTKDAVRWGVNRNLFNRFVDSWSLQCGAVASTTIVLAQ